MPLPVAGKAYVDPLWVTNIEKEKHLAFLSRCVKIYGSFFAKYSDGNYVIFSDFRSN